jgi:hypothetical protein
MASILNPLIAVLLVQASLHFVFLQLGTTLVTVCLAHVVHLRHDLSIKSVWDAVLNDITNVPSNTVLGISSAVLSGVAYTTVDLVLFLTLVQFSDTWFDRFFGRAAYCFHSVATSVRVLNQLFCAFPR